MDPIKARRIELWVTLGYTLVGIGLSIGHLFRIQQEITYLSNPGTQLVEEAEAYLGPRES